MTGMAARLAAVIVSMVAARGVISDDLDLGDGEAGEDGQAVLGRLQWLVAP